MRCDIFPNWNTDKFGRCERICDHRLKEGCGILKHRQSLKSKLIGLAEEEANVVRMILDEQKVIVNG